MLRDIILTNDFTSENVKDRKMKRFGMEEKMSKGFDDIFAKVGECGMKK